MEFARKKMAHYMQVNHSMNHLFLIKKKNDEGQEWSFNKISNKGKLKNFSSSKIVLKETLKEVLVGWREKILEINLAVWEWWNNNRNSKCLSK